MDSITTAPAAAPTAIPAGEEQRALWTAWRLAPEDPAYNMTYAVRLAPGIDPQRLAAAFAQVIAGHEALSSHFREDADGRLVMERRPGFAADVAVHATGAMSDADRLNWLEREADLPLPLARITALACGNGPLFRHMTTYVSVGERSAVNRAVRRKLFAQQRGAANELNLRWVDDGERLTGQWRADPAVFGPETSARMRRGFLALLEGAIADPDAPIAALEATTDDADRSLRRGPAAGAPTSALALFEAAVTRHPGRAAVEDDDRIPTYADLDAAAGRQSVRLADAGVRPGDRVGLWLPRGAALAVGMIAAWKAGAAYLCLDLALPDARLALLATASGARAIVGHGTAPGWLGGEACLEVDGASFDGGSGDAAPVPASPDLPAYLIYTSGSTGTPKGVVVTQGNLVQYAQGVLAAMDLPEEATLATPASVTADLGYTAWFGALLGGRTLRIIAPALADDPGVLARHFAERPVDALKIVPSHLAALMAVADPARLLPRRCLVLGGEVLEGGFVARLRTLAPGCRVLNHYGPTETTVGCLTAPPLRTRAFRSPSAPRWPASMPRCWTATATLCRLASSANSPSAAAVSPLATSAARPRPPSASCPIRGAAVAGCTAPATACASPPPASWISLAAPTIR